MHQLIVWSLENGHELARFGKFPIAMALAFRDEDELVVGNVDQGVSFVNWRRNEVVPSDRTEATQIYCLAGDATKGSFVTGIWRRSD